MPKRIAFFVTCLVDQVFPEIGMAALRLVQRAGYEILFPPGQTCCGQPFFNSGFLEEAKQLSQKTINDLKSCEQVVLPSGSCTAMLRHEYPRLWKNDPVWKPKAEALAAKTFELSEFLVRSKTDFSAAPGKKPVTYHDSCHMCRTLGLKEEPRSLLEGLTSIKEMEEPDRCCGFGGLFSVRMPEIANAMTDEKIRQAEESGTDLLVTSDPGCLMQMRSRIAKTGSSVKVLHLAEFLEENTR